MSEAELLVWILIVIALLGRSRSAGGVHVLPRPKGPRPRAAPLPPADRVQSREGGS